MPDGVEQSSFLPERVFGVELEATEEPLVARAGLVRIRQVAWLVAAPHQMAAALGLRRRIDCELPAPCSPWGHAPSAFAMPVILMLHGAVGLWMTCGNQADVLPPDCTGQAVATLCSSPSLFLGLAWPLAIMRTGCYNHSQPERSCAGPLGCCRKQAEGWDAHGANDGRYKKTTGRRVQ